MSPVSHLPLSLSLMASATTPPPRPLLVRSPTSAILSKPVDVFPSSSYLLHLSLAFYPVGHSLFLEFLSLEFTTSLGPGFPSPLSNCSSCLFSSSSTQWWCFQGLGPEVLSSSFSKLHHCSQSWKYLYGDASWKCISSTGMWVLLSFSIQLSWHCHLDIVITPKLSTTK